MKKNWKYSYPIWRDKLNVLIIILLINCLILPCMAQNQTAIQSGNNVYYTTFGFIIGTLLTGLINYSISKRNNERNARITYLSTLLSSEETCEELNNIFSEIHARKNKFHVQISDADLIYNLKKSKMLLIFSLSLEHYDNLLEEIRNENWNEAQHIILEYLSGNW